MFTRTRIGTGSLVMLALVAIVLVSWSANQDSTSADGALGHGEVATDAKQLESPAAAYTVFRQAQSTRDWSFEYQCYSPRQQARFSHTIIITALYLEFQTDLYLKVEAALNRHGLSDEDLADFWPKTMYEVTDEKSPDNYYGDFQAEYDARLDRWQREIVPKIRDCARLIATLQPLIREAARRSSSVSTVALTVRQLEGYAYGRMRELHIDGDEATGTIRVKSRFGAFVEPDRLKDNASATSFKGSAPQPPAEFRNVLVEDASGLYGWLWEVAADIQTLAQSMRHPRMVIVGLATGDVAVGPYGLAIDDARETGDAGDDANEGDMKPLERVDNRDESEEVGFANNGTRTVTEASVRFRRIDERWLVDSIDYR